MLGGNSSGRRALGKIEAVIIIIVVVAAGFVGFYAYTTFGTQSSKAPPTILLGATLSLTGSYSGYGIETLQAYQIAINATNASGGVYISQYGKKIPLKLVYLDDASNPATAVANVERLITVDHVVALLGDVTTAMVEAVAPVAERYHVPVVSTLISDPTLNQNGYKYGAFAIWPTNQQIVEQIVSFLNSLPTQYKPRTFAIAADTTGLCSNIAQNYHTLLTADGLQQVDQETVTPGATDYSPVIEHLATAKPDFLAICISSTTDAVNFFRQAKLLNFNPTDGVAGIGGLTADFGKALGNDSNFVMGNTIWSSSLTWPGNSNFTQAYESTFHTTPIYAGAGYAVAQVMIDAIRKTGSLNSTSIDNAIWSINASTVVGPVSFQQQGSALPGRAILQVALLEWQNGTDVVVYPQSIATAKLAWPWVPWSAR